MKSFNNKKKLLEEKEALSEKVAISEYTGPLSIDINIWTHKKKNEAHLFSDNSDVWK